MDGSFALDWDKRPALKRYADFLQKNVKFATHFTFANKIMILNKEISMENK